MGSYSYLLFAVFCLSRVQQVLSVEELGCSNPRLPRHMKIRHVKPKEKYPEGSALGFDCDAGYTLVGSKHTVCANGKWLDYDAQCFLEVAEGSRSHMSSQADEFASAHLASDGDPETCVAFSSKDKRLVWSLDTIQAFRVRVVTIHSQNPLPNATIEIRVGSHHPSTGAKFNKLCTRQKLNGGDKPTRQFTCENHAAVGRYVSVTIIEPEDHQISLCEVKVYSDSGLSVDDACPSKSHRIAETARFIFENQCVQFLGQNTHHDASRLCELHGGSLVTPKSRAFQRFLDFCVLKFFEATFDQVVVSFWVNAERTNSSNRWVDGAGTAIRKVQIKAEGDGKCLVSESRSWHSEPCSRQHQVICISPPVTCGSPSLPANSATRERVKLPMKKSVIIDCEPGFYASVDRVTCFPDGSLSEEPSCEELNTSSLSWNFSSKISSFLRSFSMLAKLSAEAFRAVLVGLGAVLAALVSALFTCCFYMCQRRRAKEISEKIQLSLISFSVHMKDLPVNTSTRLFRTPPEGGKESPEILKA